MFKISTISLARDSARFQKLFDENLVFCYTRMMLTTLFFFNNFHNLQPKSFVCQFYYGTLSRSHSNIDGVVQKETWNPFSLKKKLHFLISFLLFAFFPRSLVIRQILREMRQLLNACFGGDGSCNEFKLHMTKFLQLFLFLASQKRPASN